MSVNDLWKAAEPLITVTEKHPFLIAMVDGTLNMECFQYYMLQDALYLTDFADGLRRVSRNAPAEKDAKQLELFAQIADEAEKSLHGGFVKEWNMTLEGVEQMPHTLLYTSYIKRVVVTRPYQEALACLLPCFWIYMHVGELMTQMRDEMGASVNRSPEYDAWIDKYGGDEVKKTVMDYIALVDAAYKTADAKCRQEMEKHFIIGCKLEHMFWDQAANKMQWPTLGE